MIAAFVGLTIAVAVRAVSWLAVRRVGEDGPADDENAGHRAQSPVNS